MGSQELDGFQVGGNLGSLAWLHSRPRGQPRRWLRQRIRPGTPGAWRNSGIFIPQVTGSLSEEKIYVISIAHASGCQNELRKLLSGKDLKTTRCSKVALSSEIRGKKARGAPEPGEHCESGLVQILCQGDPSEQKCPTNRPSFYGKISAREMVRCRCHRWWGPERDRS
jgi:hypothetical protein